jgi:pyruvate kinase
VANAIIDGTDAVMLSAETATAKFPWRRQVDGPDREEIENSHDPGHRPALRHPGGAAHDRVMPTESAIAAATVEAVRRLDAPLIVTFTSSGFTARVVSSFRPPVPILALTDSPRTYHQLALVWGVIPVLCPSPVWSFDQMLAFAREVALDRGLAERGQRVVVTAGSADAHRGHDQYAAGGGDMRGQGSRPIPA